MNLSFSCKKYPENIRLSLYRVSKARPISGHITSYKIDGIDSITSSEGFFDTSYVNYIQKNNLQSDYPLKINEISFRGFIDEPEFEMESLAKGSYSLENRSKYIRISCFEHYSIPITRVFKRDIFVGKNLKWKILRFENSGLRKYETSYNGRVYEITFSQK